MTGLAQILDENRRLRELITEKEAVLREKDELLQTQRNELAKRDAMLEALKERAEELAQQLALLKRKASGPASERFIPDNQPLLPFLGEITPPPRAPRPEADDAGEANTKDTDTIKPRRRGKMPKRRNREDFRHLPSRTVRCHASADASCAGCGGVLGIIGQAVSFRIEWEPGHYVVEEVIRDKCTCPACPDEGVLTVPAPYALDRALCGDGLLTRVLIDKFLDHLPLHRQARRMDREGFAIGSNTLAGWVLKGAGLLGCVAGAVKKELMTGSFLQGDDTGFPIQDGEDGQLRKGRLWAFTDQEQVFYAFTPTKEGEYPAVLLADFTGKLLLVDGGSEFNEVVRQLGLERAGCWSHLRSYFFRARHDHPVEVALALGTIRDVFVLERTLVDLPPEARRAVRQAQAKPLIDGLFDWMKALSVPTRPKSLLGKALGYGLNQEAALRVYLEHGELPMHNNLSELQLRQGVVGRKNWLFARSEGGAEAAATMYTLLGSCILQGIDPQEYLVDILSKLPDYPVNRVSELTPKAWRLAREHHTAKGA